MSRERKNGTRVPGTTHERTDVPLRSDLRLARSRDQRAKRYAITRAIAIRNASEAVRFLWMLYVRDASKMNCQLKIKLKDVLRREFSMWA